MSSRSLTTPVRYASVLACALIAALAFGAGSASAATPATFFNGFEVDESGWLDNLGTIDRVPSGTNGIASADGDYHAEASGEFSGPFTRFGGYTDEFPATGYSTGLDVYLDLDRCPGNDSRFEWTSAINDPAGAQRRDFVFNMGCYTDDGDYAVVSASNNAYGWPKNPGRDPLRIDDEGWYTLQHDFHDDGSGVLAVDLSVVDSSGTTLKTWTLSNPTDLIGTTVGGNRYGWIVWNQLDFLAVDNSRLDVSVGPPTGKDECKKGGWQEFDSPSFKNQGDCVSYVATGGRNPGSG